MTTTPTAPIPKRGTAPKGLYQEYFLPTWSEALELCVSSMVRGIHGKALPEGILLETIKPDHMGATPQMRVSYTPPGASQRLLELTTTEEEVHKFSKDGYRRALSEARSYVHMLLSMTSLSHDDVMTLPELASLSTHKGLVALGRTLTIQPDASADDETKSSEDPQNATNGDDLATSDDSEGSTADNHANDETPPPTPGVSCSRLYKRMNLTSNASNRRTLSRALAFWQATGFKARVKQHTYEGNAFVSACLGEIDVRTDHFMDGSRTGSYRIFQIAKDFMRACSKHFVRVPLEAFGARRARDFLAALSIFAQESLRHRQRKSKGHVEIPLDKLLPKTACLQPARTSQHRALGYLTAVLEWLKTLGLISADSRLLARPGLIRRFYESLRIEHAPATPHANGPPDPRPTR